MQGESKQAAISSDSDYDVDGVDDGVGSVSSKDDRRNQLMDVEPSDNLRNNTPPVQTNKTSILQHRTFRIPL